MTSPRLELYYAPGACSLAAHIALEESALPYAAHAISLARGEQKTPEYLALAPAGKVPVLAVDGVALTENVAILDYIASLVPERGLTPAEPFARAQAMSLLSWCASTVHPSFRHVARPELLAGDDPSMRAAVSGRSRAQFIAACATIDAALEGRDWALGDRFSVCDGYLLVFYLWTVRAEVEAALFVNFTRHARRMLKRASVATVLEREGALERASGLAGI